MTTRRTHAGRTRPGRAGPRAWSLWSLPRPALAYVLVVDTAAVVVGVLAVWREHVPASHWLVTGLLFLGSVVHAEAARHIERVRIAATGRPFIDLKSMWTFACLLLTCLAPAIVLTVAAFAYWWARNENRPPPHRWVFSGATVVLATAAAQLVLPESDLGSLLTGLSGPAAMGLVAVAVLVRWVVNHGLVVGVILLTAPSAATRRHLATPADTLLGLGSLALGVALAVLAAASPWLVPILLVPVVVLHRGVLVDQFAQAARTDLKTGLAHGAAWTETAHRELERAGRTGRGAAVLMVDVDNFKRVNDAHGHLVGDDVLRAIARTLTLELRDHDAVGRFGGEEFALLLSGVGPRGAVRAADRVRERVGELRVTLPGTRTRVGGFSVSVGAATFPEVSRSLDELLAAADGALYRAKEAGRDRTVLATGTDPRPASDGDRAPDGPPDRPADRPATR